MRIFANFIFNVTLGLIMAVVTFCVVYGDPGGVQGSNSTSFMSLGQWLHGLLLLHNCGNPLCGGSWHHVGAKVLAATSESKMESWTPPP